MKWIAADPNWGSIEKVQGECRTSRKGTHWTQVTESSTKEGCTFVLRSILNFNIIFECKKALKFITEVENSKYREAKDSCVKEESANGVLMWNNAALSTVLVLPLSPLVIPRRFLLHFPLWRSQKQWRIKEGLREEKKRAKKAHYLQRLSANASKWHRKVCPLPFLIHFLL